MSFINTLHEVENMNTLFRDRKQVVILITVLLLTISACASSTKVIKNVYSSHPGGQGHPWDKGRSF
jgi:capsular polysaccharide biosynthesis protein